MTPGLDAHLGFKALSPEPSVSCKRNSAESHVSQMSPIYRHYLAND